MTKGFDDALGQIEKMFGSGAIVSMSQKMSEEIESFSTGSILLDEALGTGGLPRGRIVEIYGPESAGKTTLVYHVLAAAQKEGHKCVFIDAEHALDPVYAANLGVDVESLYISQPDYGEQALEIASRVISSGEVAVVAIDSVAALTPRAEVEGQMGDQTIGLQARMMGQAMRKLAHSLNNTNTLCIFTNQLRSKVGVFFGSSDTTPGGNALKFYASQRLDLRRIETLKDANQPTGIRVRAKVVKNKLAAPFQQAEYVIRFGEGISQLDEIVDLGLSKKVLEAKGAWISYKGKNIAQGRQKLLEKLSDDDLLVSEIRSAILSKEGKPN